MDSNLANSDNIDGIFLKSPKSKNSTLFPSGLLFSRTNLAVLSLGSNNFKVTSLAPRLNKIYSNGKLVKHQHQKKQNSVSNTSKTISTIIVNKIDTENLSKKRHIGKAKV